MTPKTFVRFAQVTLAITVVVILWGAVVRATGSGAGCGNAASVNSSLCGPARVSSCTESSGMSRSSSPAEYNALPKASSNARCTASEMPRVVLMSRLVVRNEVQNDTAAAWIANAA